jgi:outer membrane protein assembly factor BamA
VRLAIVMLTACHAAVAPYPAVDPGCSESRVGKVLTEGASAAEIAPLAVLEGTLDDPPRTERIARVAEELLRVRGYARAEVRVDRVKGCGVELHVAVTRGPKFRIAQIALAGAPDGDTAVLADALGTVNAVGGTYVEDRMRRASAHLVQRYKDAGWLELEVDPPVASFDERAGTVRVTIPVRSGRRFRIGSVIARGAGAATRARVLETLALRGGDWYDASAVRDAIARVRRELDRRVDVHVEVGADRVDLDAVVGERR